mgnify:CR=1 FL=1
MLVARDGRIIGRQSAMCMNDEPNWKKKPIFQLRSMAQTRASSRVYASVFRFVTVLAENVEGTPAEELDTEPALPRGRDRVGHSHPAITRTTTMPEHEDARDAPAPPVTIAKDRAARLPLGVCLITRIVEDGYQKSAREALHDLGHGRPELAGRHDLDDDDQRTTRGTRGVGLASGTAGETHGEKGKFGYELESIEDAARERTAATRDDMPPLTDKDIPF